jgi:hypothetical protein
MNAADTTEEPWGKCEGSRGFALKRSLAPVKISTERQKDLFVGSVGVVGAFFLRGPNEFQMNTSWHPAGKTTNTTFPPLSTTTIGFASSLTRLVWDHGVPSSPILRLAALSSLGSL